MSKLKQFFKPINNETIHPYVEDFRQKNIPKRYNQIKLMNYLLDDELDHYISISNRSDGKSFNYVDFLIKFAIDYDIGFMFIVRHHTVQLFGQTLMQKIIDTSSNDYNPRDFIFLNNEFFKSLIYNNKSKTLITYLKKKYNKTNYIILINNKFYKTLHYKDKAIALITDLNKATDLKYNSNYLKDFPIMVYDEFLALEGDYLPDEWERLKTIYASVNRDDE